MVSLYNFHFTGMWHVMTRVFPQVRIMRCAFHWCQSVWRKTCDLGLKTAYMRHAGVHQYVRILLALPFLPAEHIKRGI